MANFKYPNKVFSGGAANEFPAGYIDYIKFTSINTFVGNSEASPANYAFSLGSSDSSNSQTKSYGDSCYLYIPSTLQSNYAASYNSVALGAAGMAAANALKSSSTVDLATAIQGFAVSAGPEFGFGTLAKGLSGIADLAGTGGGQLSASQLSAISQGKIFNPYMEQIFEAPGFRDHNFTFKLVARNKEEAKDIQNIIKFFKVNMLPNTNGYSPTESKGGVGGGTGAAAQNSKDALVNDQFFQSINSAGIAGNRWLTVPNKFDIAFQRFNLGATNGAVSSNDNNINSLYKFKTCVLKNCQINYAPDGQYTAFDPNSKTDGVPAVQIDLSFSETQIITAKDANEGY
jgi:hypothetical protein